MQVFTGRFSSEDMPLEISVFLEDGILKARATGQVYFR